MTNNIHSHLLANVNKNLYQHLITTCFLDIRTYL